MQLTFQWGRQIINKWVKDISRQVGINANEEKPGTRGGIFAIINKVVKKVSWKRRYLRTDVKAVTPRHAHFSFRGVCQSPHQMRTWRFHLIIFQSPTAPHCLHTANAEGHVVTSTNGMFCMNTVVIWVVLKRLGGCRLKPNEAGRGRAATLYPHDFGVSWSS